LPHALELTVYEENLLSDSSQNQIRDVLVETARGHLAARKRKKLAGIRVSPGGYFATAALLTFAALLCLRTQHELLALILIGGTWTIIPFLILTNRLSFDGHTVSRTGLAAMLMRLVRGRAQSLAVEDIERVEVATLRTLRRGGKVRYRYRVEIAGKGWAFVLASGGHEFRRMVRVLLPRISDYKLDARARELRDHLGDVKAVRRQAAVLGIAPTAVLEETSDTRRADRYRAVLSVGLAAGLANDLATSATANLPGNEASHEDAERASLLRKSANDLRMSGFLHQSAEAFRRALLISPRSPWLIYEYARLLKSQASAFGDARLLARACAALRLAATRGPTDAALLVRVGECFLEYGDPQRAAKLFRRTLDVDEDAYRAQLGLAEVALSDGKLAHVIHHYSEAARVAPDKAAATLARREADYYSRLNNDEDYLAAELRRMNWLEGANRIQHLTARVSFAALLIALIGSSVDQVVAGLGWAFASSSIVAWSGSLVIRKLLAARGRAETSDA
jgi:tetratricopeptide (TPR) repeat protein